MTRTLVAAIGQSPQVITETLSALGRAAAPAAIHLVGTEPSARQARQVLVGSEGALVRLHRARGIPLLRARDVHLHVLRGVDGAPLGDIRSTVDNEAVALQVVDVVRRLVAQSDVLLGSIAGGRKTLGLYMALAFQLYGRPEDRLYHELVPAEAEQDRDWFFPTRQKPYRVDLAEIPFLRLRDLLPARGNGQSLAGLLAFVQARVHDCATLRLRVAGWPSAPLIFVGEQRVRCRDADAALWAAFATRRKQCRAGGSVECGCCFLPIEAVPSEWIPKAWLARTDQESSALSLRPAFSRIRRSLATLGLSASATDHVAIAAVGQRGQSRYGIRLAPEAIVIEEGSDMKADQPSG